VFNSICLAWGVVFPCGMYYLLGDGVERKRIPSTPLSYLLSG
jgi:hypothetical protein